MVLRNAACESDCERGGREEAQRFETRDVVAAGGKKKTHLGSLNGLVVFAVVPRRDLDRILVSFESRWTSDGVSRRRRRSRGS